MGGHGGLNILPQKRWNVYNFENREKVRKDEEAAAEQERQVADEQRCRDGEIRREILLARARERRAELTNSADNKRLLPGSGGDGAKLLNNDTSTSAKDSAAEETNERPAAGAPLTDGSERGQVTDKVDSPSERTPAAATLEGTGTDPAAVHSGDRFSLFQEEESRASAGPATLKTGKGGGSADRGKKRDCEAVKGDEDERYRLGYGAKKPWYATVNKGEALSTINSSNRMLPTSNTFDHAHSVTPSEGNASSHKKRKKEKEKHKHKHKHKHPEKLKEKLKSKDRVEESRQSSSDQLAKLRKERLEREEKERLRMSKLLAQRGHSSATEQQSQGISASGLHSSRGYNSGFGYGR